MRKLMIYVCSAAVAMAVTAIQPITSMAAMNTCTISGNGQRRIVIGGGKNKCLEQLMGNGNWNCDKPGSGVPGIQEPEENQNPSDWEVQVVELVNTERAKAGLSALKLNRNAAGAAQVRAREISSVFSHTRPDGNGFQTALDDAGVSYRSYGENIAYGQKSPQAVMNQWMNSAGHRANILNPNFTEIGVGHYKTAAGVDYWTQLFVR